MRQDRIKRDKAFLGAIIGAATGIAGSLLGAHAQKKQIRQQQRVANRNATYEMANNLTNSYGDQDYVDEFQNKVKFKYGGKKHCYGGNRKKYGEGGKLWDASDWGSLASGVSGAIGNVIQSSVNKNIKDTPVLKGNPKSSIKKPDYTYNPNSGNLVNAYGEENNMFKKNVVVPQYIAEYCFGGKRRKYNYGGYYKFGGKDEHPLWTRIKSAVNNVKNGVKKAYRRLTDISTTSQIAQNVTDAVTRNPVRQLVGSHTGNYDVGNTYNATGARLSRMQADIDKDKLPTEVGQIVPFGIKAGAIKRFNEQNPNANGKYANFNLNSLADAAMGGVSAWEYNTGQTSGEIQIDPEDNTRYLVHLHDAYTFDDSNANDANAAKSSAIRRFLGNRGRKDGDPNANQQDFYYSIPVEGNDTVRSYGIYDDDYANGNPNIFQYFRYKRAFSK